MLRQTDAEIIIDCKDFSGDKFDDLRVKTPNSTTEFQIKYSDDESSLQKRGESLIRRLRQDLSIERFLLENVIASHYENKFEN